MTKSSDFKFSSYNCNSYQASSLGFFVILDLTLLMVIKLLMLSILKALLKFVCFGRRALLVTEDFSTHRDSG